MLAVDCIVGTLMQQLNAEIENGQKIVEMLQTQRGVFRVIASWRPWEYKII